ncbi:MAG: hypothetical protein FWH41_04040 [Treponema sp.]|nr:hypothetical protein [Treponema sp.]
MSRGGMKSQTVDNSVVALGDNEFETGSIAVPGGSIINKGVVLKREGNKFAPLTDSEEEIPVAVNPFDIPNTASSAADLSIRAIISGPVRASLLSINGEPLTNEEFDMLRDHATIIPVKDHDISRTG